MKSSLKTTGSKYWALTLVVLWALSLALTPALNTEYTRFSDADLSKTGAWKVVDLARYSEGHAAFTRESGATASVSFERSKSVSQVDIRYYSYGTETNTLTLSAGGKERVITYTEKGSFTHLEVFDPPVMAEAVTLTLSDLKQPAWVLDTLSFRHDRGPDIKRALWQMALFTLLTGALFLSTRYTVTPISSSGKIYVSIDIFRGIGALLVLFLHSTGYAGLPDLGERPVLANIAKNGHYGVEVFYVISAFTLTYSLASALKKEAANPISAFWNRRVNRIIPTFLAMFILAILFRKILSSGFTSENLVPTFVRFMNMTYIFDRTTLLTPIGHSVWWSISTEFQFYIIMPLLFFPVMAYVIKDKPRSSRKNIALALGMAVASIALMAFSREAFSGKSWLAYTLFYHLDAFVVGIALAIIMMEWTKIAALKASNTACHTEAKTQSKTVWTVLAYCGFAGLLFTVAYSQYMSAILGLPKALVGGRLIVILATSVSVFAVRFCEERGADLTGSRALRTVGLLSFLIYLVHIPVLQVFTKIPVPEAVGTDMAYYMWVMTGGIIGSLLVSVIIHRVVEVPAMRLNGLASTFPALRAITTGLIVFIIVAFVYSFAIN